MIAFAMTKQHY